MTTDRDNTAARRKKALGRGLDALLGPRTAAAAPAPAPVADAEAPGALAEAEVRQVSLEAIDPNPHQPRTEFVSEALEELARSIKADGVIQPILVRPNGSRYLLVAGERRLRAARAAGLATIPAVVREIEDDKLLEIALIENIQREDLNPIEVAGALQRLAQASQLSHEELAQRTGKDRSTITNLLRLLRLPSDIQSLVAEKRLSMGHARARCSLFRNKINNAMLRRRLFPGSCLFVKSSSSSSKCSSRRPILSPLTLPIPTSRRRSKSWNARSVRECA